MNGFPRNICYSKLLEGRTGTTQYCIWDKDYDIFIGGVGNQIAKPAETSATQFVVIEDLACSPHNGMHVQVRINTTDYLKTPMSQTKKVFQERLLISKRRPSIGIFLGSH